MPQDATTLETGEPLRAAPRDRVRGSGVVEAAADRGKAFSEARKHTFVVRSLRLFLPVAAVMTLASYGLFMQRSIKVGFGNKTIEAGSFSLSREALVAHDPRYTGFDKNGGAFEVKAKTAEQDLKQKGIVRLKGIDGNMIDASRNRTDMKAVRGVLDTNTNVLELAEKIDVVSQNGMTAELTQATVYTKENRIISEEPVVVRMPSGTVRGQAMTIEQKERKVLFSGGVVANLKAQPKAPAAKAGEVPMRGAQDPAQAARNDAPVDITSRTLLIDDTAKTATFSGKVVAKQTDQVLETSELEVFYEGQATGQQALPQGQQQERVSTQAAGPGQGRMRRLIAKSDVVLTRGVEKATGSSGEFDAVNDKAVLLGPVVISAGADRGATADRADIDNKTDQILLTGNVVVTQEKNVLKGRRLQADRKQGLVQLSSPAIGNQGKGQISAKLYQAEGDQGAAKKKPGAAAAAPKGGLIGGDMRGDPSQPIDIDADTLDVDDKKKTAVFKGRVKAVQGDYSITTEELVATYAGEAGLALTPQVGQTAPVQQVAGAPVKTGAQLQSIVSPRRARITTKDGQRAEGDTVAFDPKANTAKLSGNVLLSKGAEFTTAGQCAVLDMNTGVMRLIDACGFSQSATTISGPAAGGAAAKTAASLVKGEAVPGRRAQVLLYPQQMKDMKRDAAKTSASGAAPPAASATPASTPATPAAVPPVAPAEAGQPRRSPSPVARDGGVGDVFQSR